MKKLIISLIVITVFLTGSFVLSQTKNNDLEGQITIIIIDETGDTISNLTYDFTEEDSVFSILEDNYDIGCADSSYNMDPTCVKPIIGGRVILKIDSLVTDWSTSYIGIYENDLYSSNGIDLLSLNDNDVYKFRYHYIGGDN